MHHQRSVRHLSILSGGRGRDVGAARRSSDPVLDRLFYFVPTAVPDFCPDCGAHTEAELHAWGPSWRCSEAACRKHAPQLVELVFLDLLLRASPDWTCTCCGEGLAVHFDQLELLPTCSRHTTTDWLALRAQLERRSEAAG